jgi:hypothetical protein
LGRGAGPKERETGRCWAPAFGQPSEREKKGEETRAGPRVRGGELDFS